MFNTFINFCKFFKSLILLILWIRDFCDFMSYLPFWLYCGCRCAKAKKLRNREYKVCLNERAMVRLLDVLTDCNIDKSIKNFPIAAHTAGF